MCPEKIGPFLIVKVAGCWLSRTAFLLRVDDQGDTLSAMIARRRVPPVTAELIFLFNDPTATCFKRVANMKILQANCF